MIIPSDSVKLQGILQESAQLRGAAVLCHPHPLHGGTMQNRVIFRAAKAALASGLACLRFNFRGVGGSTGSFGGGSGEQQDVLAAVDWLAKRYPGVPLVSIGFSFGAWVGLQVGTRDVRVKALVGIGVPLNAYDFEFLSQNVKPSLFVIGTRDEFCPVARMQRLASRLPSASTVKFIEDADHFFSNAINELQENITEFLRLLNF